jgi:P-type Cu2+ transporter
VARGARAQPARDKAAAANPRPGKKATAHFTVDGMYCASCAVSAEDVLKTVPGVSDAAVSFGAAQGRVDYDPTVTNPTELMNHVHALGYHTHLPSIDEDGAAAQARSENILVKLIVAVAFGMQIELLYLTNLYPFYAQGTFGTPEIKSIEYIAMFLCAPIFFYSGSVFLRGAFEEIKAKTVNMNALVAIGISASFGYSVYMTLFGRGPVFFDSTALIVAFVSVGRYLESIGGDDARREIRSLLDINPRTARVIHDGMTMTMPVETVRPGNIVSVSEGEIVPADAVVEDGTAEINESLVTGESSPVSKKPSSLILAGSSVASGSVTARVVKAFDQSRLAQMRDAVKQTLMAKPPLQQLADRAAGWLTFTILALAAVTLAGWLITGHSAGAGVLAAVAVLVVACPCALGIATPLAITVSLGRAVRAGVAVRNPGALESASHLDHIVFDKTGTLTVGRPTVTAVQSVEDTETGDDELLCLAAAVEQFSSHPVGQAIAAACPTPAEARDFAPLSGMGGRAILNDGTPIMVGTEYLVPSSYESPLAGSANMRRAAGESVVWVQVDGKVLGFLALSDPPDQRAEQAIEQLEADGISAEILSGDAPATVKALADNLHVAESTGALSPAAKARVIAARQHGQHQIGMVGDGANDAPALAQADVSFTVASGTTIAGETSDVLLVRDDLRLAPWFIKLSRVTNRVIKQNLGWAMIYNVVAVPLAAFGVIRPAIAAVAMAVSSLIVVMNSLRLKSIRLL